MNNTQIYRWQKASEDNLPEFGRWVNLIYDHGDIKSVISEKWSKESQKYWRMNSVTDWCYIVMPWEEINTQERETAAIQVLNEIDEYLGHETFEKGKPVLLNNIGGGSVLHKKVKEVLKAAQFSTSVPVSGDILNELGEKEVMCAAFDKVRKLFRSRSWIMEGRGSYPYNDDRYKEEVRYLYDEFEALATDTWANIKTKTFEYRKKIIADFLKEKNVPVSEEEKKKPTHDELCELASDVFKDIPADSGLNEIPRSKFNNDQFKRKEGFITGWWYGFEKLLSKKP